MEAVCFIKPHRGELSAAGFKNETTVAEAACLADQMSEHRAREAFASMRTEHVHPSKLGRGVIARPQGAACKCASVDMGDDIRAALRQWIVRRRCVGSVEQFGIKRARFAGGFAQQRHGIGALRVDVADFHDADCRALASYEARTKASRVL